MQLKKPLTYKKQLKLLKSRHLIIKNDNVACDILSHVNYYRLSAYGLGLKDKNDIFNENVTLEQIYNLYKFDIELRHKVIELIEYIEIDLRTSIAYSLAFKYGSEAYLRSDCFNDVEQFARFACNFYNDKKRNRSLIVRHHVDKYDGKIPIWAVVEIFTFGTMSKLYSNLTTEIQKKIAKTFLQDADNYIIGVGYLKGWLKSLVEIRNICAHFDRLYNRIFLSPPKLYKEHSDMGIDNRRFFAFLLVIGRLTYSRRKWIKFINDIAILINKYDDVRLDFMGFPPKWKSILYNVKSYKLNKQL